MKKKMVKELKWKEIKKKVKVDGVVKVIDEEEVEEGSFEEENEKVDEKREEDEYIENERKLEEIFEDKINEEEIIVIKKEEMIDDEKMDRVKEDVEES